MYLTFAGPITMSTCGHGDAEVVIEIAPTLEQPMILDEIAVGFFGNDDEWAEFLSYYSETGTLSWCVEGLRLSARPNVKVPKTVVDDATGDVSDESMGQSASGREDQATR
jgi:hypothetical protein